MLLDNVQFLVDIFHVSKHTKEVCMPAENPNCRYDPHLPRFDEIRGVNTESCEQGFKRLNQYFELARKITQFKAQLTPIFFFRKTKTSNCHDTFGEKISVIDEILAILQLFKVEVPLSRDRAFVGSGTSLNVTSSKEWFCYVLQSIDALFRQVSLRYLKGVE